jgi:hypothetical protein
MNAQNGFSMIGTIGCACAHAQMETHQEFSSQATPAKLIQENDSSNLAMANTMLHSSSLLAHTNDNQTLAYSGLLHQVPGFGCHFTLAHWCRVSTCSGSTCFPDRLLLASARGICDHHTASQHFTHTIVHPSRVCADNMLLS